MQQVALRTFAGESDQASLKKDDVREPNMIDASTRKPLSVSTDGNAVPYIMVPVQQIDEVRALLDGHNIPYWLDDFAISLDGKPAVTVLNLGSGVDAAIVQDLLDNAD